MQTLVLVSIIAFLSLSSTSIGQAKKTFDTVVAGTKCYPGVPTVGQTSSSTMECDYVVGRSLHIIIAGVGEKDPSVAFMSSSFDGVVHGL